MERTLGWLTATLKILFSVEAVVLFIVAVAPGTAWSGVAFVGFVTIAGPFTVWLFRATQGLEALGRRGRFRPEAAPVACFLPFVNAVVPFLMLFDIWRGSTCAVSGRGPRPPLSLPLWWASTVAGITLLGTGPGTRDSELSLPAFVLAVSALFASHAVGRLTVEQVRAAGRAGVAGEAPATRAGLRFFAVLSTSVVAAWSLTAAATEFLLIVVAGWRAGLGRGSTADGGAPVALAVGVIALLGALALLRSLEEPTHHR